MRKQLRKINITLTLVIVLFPITASALEFGKTKLTGSIESYFQSFTTDKDSTRLPEQTYRIQLNSQLEGYNFTIPIKLIIDQDQSNLRQSINKFLFNPKWTNAELWLGDFYPVMSDLSVSGINLQGVGVKLNSKAFRLQISGGQANRPIEPKDSIGGTFRRYLVASKLGFGNENSFYLDVNGLKAWDDTTSIQLGTSLPQDNLLVSVQTGVKAGFFKLSGEYAASGHTRNTLASDAKSIQPNPIIDPLFTTHIGSQQSDALLLSTMMEWSLFSIKGDFKRISPGFISLGRTYSDEDIQDISSEIRLRTGDSKFSLTLSGGASNDNLTDEKIFTSYTYRGAMLINTQISPKVNINLGYSGLLLQNDASANPMDQLNNSISLNPTFRFGQASNSQILALTLMRQWLDDRSGLTGGFTNLFGNASWTFIKGTKLTLTAGNY